MSIYCGGCFKGLFAAVLFVGVSAIWAAPGVDVSAVNDTVMRIHYSGGNPNSVHPAVTVTGKRFGVRATANNTSGATALSGIVAGYTAPWVLTSGVTGAGFYGLTGGGVYGVYGEGSDIGVYGLGKNIGILGRSESNGYQAIGTSGEAVGGYYNIGVYGSAWHGYQNWAGYFDGTVIASQYLTFSDERAKRNVTPMTPTLERVMRVRARAYDLDPDFQGRGKSNSQGRGQAQGRHFGVIAQELEEVFPELVTTVSRPAVNDSGRVDFSTTPTDYKAVDYTSLIPVLIQAIQEQQEQIDALKALLQER